MTLLLCYGERSKTMTICKTFDMQLGDRIAEVAPLWPPLYIINIDPSSNVISVVHLLLKYLFNW